MNGKVLVDCILPVLLHQNIIDMYHILLCMLQKMREFCTQLLMM